jgi:sugar/nucleoside kinase (ribokinase family)
VIGTGILCVGGLNSDTAVIGPVPETVSHLVPAYQPYSEMLVSDPIAARIETSARTGELPWEAALGGSAFNVMRILVSLAPEIRLGFAGAAGRIEGRHPHLDFLAANRVDVEFAHVSEQVAARSIAFAADGDRTIFTSLGANSEITGLLDHGGDALSRYAAGFAYVHITSFLDHTAAAGLAASMRAALAINPELIVSVDPGHGWSAAPDHGVEALLRVTRILHATATEIAALGGRVGNEPNADVVARVRMLLSDRTVYILSRKHDGVTLYSEDAAGLLESTELGNDERLEGGTVVDATGAGDTFTAVTLAALLSQKLQLALGAQLGSAVARAKIRQPGPLSSEGARAATAAFLKAPAYARGTASPLTATGSTARERES